MIAGVPVRNRATWTGGLVMANEFGFLSDMVTIVQAARATLLIRDCNSIQCYDLEHFLELDLTAKVIISMTIPYEKAAECYSTYKVMPRHGVSVVACTRAGRLAFRICRVVLYTRMLMRMSMPLSVGFPKKSRNLLLSTEE
eukprot:m.115182 g.115182  ORF g.115182 m.115182 type:complete len:141 (+) comp37536_c0_seq4:571-993(+)